MNNSAIEKCSLFSGLSREEIQRSLDRVSYRIEHYKKNEMIISAMEEAEKIGVILEGRAEVQKIFPNGGQVNMNVRTPGDLIGPVAAFSKPGRYPCDLIALDDTDVLFLQKRELIRLMKENEQIMQNFIDQIANAAYMLQQKLEIFSYSGIAQKAAVWLLMYHRRTGKRIFSIPDSVTRWALLMNVSRPSLHRELKKMEDKGFIRYAPPVIEILDTNGLESVLS